MKKFLSFCLTATLFLSCSKSDSNDPVVEDKYMSGSPGSTWNYQTTNNAGPTPVVTSYTVTSTNRDTTINSKSYHIFNISTGGLQYYNISGNDYYQYDTLPAALSSVPIERLYLKDNIAANVQWPQTFLVVVQGFPLQVTATNVIAAKDITRTVNNVVYNNVIQVNTTLSLNSPIPGLTFNTNISAYYAKKFGMIENTNIINVIFGTFTQSTNTTTKLMSANLL